MTRPWYFYFEQCCVIISKTFPGYVIAQWRKIETETKSKLTNKRLLKLLILYNYFPFIDVIYTASLASVENSAKNIFVLQSKMCFNTLNIFLQLSLKMWNAYWNIIKHLLGIQELSRITEILIQYRFHSQINIWRRQYHSSHKTCRFIIINDY